MATDIRLDNNNIEVLGNRVYFKRIRTIIPLLK